MCQVSETFGHSRWLFWLICTWPWTLSDGTGSFTQLFGDLLLQLSFVSWSSMLFLCLLVTGMPSSLSHTCVTCAISSPVMFTNGLTNASNCNVIWQGHLPHHGGGVILGVLARYNYSSTPSSFCCESTLSTLHSWWPSDCKRSREVRPSKRHCCRSRNESHHGAASSEMMIGGNLGSLYIIIHFCFCKKKSLSLGFLRGVPGFSLFAIRRIHNRS